MLCLLFTGFTSTALAAQSVSDFSDPKAGWTEFKELFKRSYSSQEEEAARYENFLVNFEEAVSLQKEHDAYGGDATFGLTQFMDLSKAEFRSQYLNSQRGKPLDAREIEDVLNHRVSRTKTNPRALTCQSDTSCDWTALGAVTKVKDQGQCGSCWAFSTTEGTESAWYLGGHDLPVLAPQQIVSCDTVDNGCNGGDITTGFNYVLHNGLEAESSYPYTANNAHCTYDNSSVVATLQDWEWGIPPCIGPLQDDCNNQDEEGLWGVVYNQGPMSICVDASHWSSYTGGIYNASNCKHGYWELDHCVQLTGYGTSAQGEKYWVVRNSWGSSWGEDGYIWLAYGENMCGVADEVIYGVSN